MMLAKTEGRPNIPRDGRHCDLCGCSQPAVRCDKCGCQIFCLSCDDMYHRHPKRRFHLRKAVDPTPPTIQARPVLPMKVAHMPIINPGDPSKMPLPPPRKKKPGKSFFDTFRRRSPPSDNSPPLPKKEYSWTDRLGNIKKFMSNRPLPPLPNSNGADESDFQQNVQSEKHDLSFIHKRVDEKPPQLPQRSLKPNEFARGSHDKENHLGSMQGNGVRDVRNGTLNPSQMSRNTGFSEEDQWNNRNSENHHPSTLMRQAQPGFMYPGNPGYPGNVSNNMHQSASTTDLQNLNTIDGQGIQPPHYPHYPMNPHMPPHYPYPMYHPQYPNYPQYFGNSFANLSNQPTTTDADFSDQSEASSRHHSSRKYPFRKRAKRSQSVMVDRMAYPGQFFPFGPFPPGYGPGPWGPPFPMEQTPPSPASSIRSLNRIGRTRRRKKTTSEDEEEEFSVSSSPLSRNKSSSSERPPPAQKAPPVVTTSSEEESEEAEKERSRSRSKSRNERVPRRDSDPKRIASPVVRSPPVSHKKTLKQKKKDTLRHSDAEEIPQSPAKFDRLSPKDLKAGQNDQEQASSTWTPPSQWQCVHCTYINPAGNRICQVCCKTATAEITSLVSSRPNSASADSRKQSVSSEKNCSSPEKRIDEEEEDVDTKRNKQDMAVLNSALDEAEKEISRGLEELMKLKEDFPSNKSDSRTTRLEDKKHSSEPTPAQSKPVYKSTGKMRKNFLDKLTMPPTTPSTKSTMVSTSTETQTGQNSTSDRVIEARRGSTSSTTSDAYNSPIAQSPQLERMDLSCNKPLGAISKSGPRKDSSCQTQTDDLTDYLERRKVEEDAYFRRPSNGYGFGYGDRMDNVTSPLPSMYDRGYPMMQRSHSRASLFTGRMNDLGPLDYGLGPSPMYRSVSRSSLTGDYPDNSFSEFHNLRKPAYYLSMEELVERRRQDSIRAQGLELVRMIREAEQQGFTADDIQVALQNCEKQSPMDWLQENWKQMVEQVINLSASYANDKKENDVGTISESEARDALRMHKGNIWAAVTECVESRQRKFLELKARGKFSSKDITDSLTSNQGDVEMSYAKLTKSASKPFLMRIWGAGEGAQNQDGAMPKTNETMKNLHNFEFKNKVDVDDIQSDEAWDEDEEDVEWDDEYDEEEEEEEQGDLEDLQTCHDDVCTSSEVKTPDSDRSDYCDAFGSNTLERNISSPSNDTFFVIPDNKPNRRGSFLSKLAGLRKSDKGAKQTSQSMFYDEEQHISSESPCGSKELTSQGNNSTDQSKGYNPISVIKSTISAIRDTVNGTSKSEKKLPCAAPERRTIIVKGQIEHESIKADEYGGGGKLNSIKSLTDGDSILNENTGVATKYSKPSDEMNENKNVLNTTKCAEEEDKNSKSGSESRTQDAESYLSQTDVIPSDGSERIKPLSELNSLQDQCSSKLQQSATKSEIIEHHELKNQKTIVVGKDDSSKTRVESSQRIKSDDCLLKSNSEIIPNDLKLMENVEENNLVRDSKELITNKNTPTASPEPISSNNKESSPISKSNSYTSAQHEREDIKDLDNKLIENKQSLRSKGTTDGINLQTPEYKTENKKSNFNVQISSSSASNSKSDTSESPVKIPSMSEVKHTVSENSVQTNNTDKPPVNDKITDQNDIIFKSSIKEDKSKSLKGDIVTASLEEETSDAGLINNFNETATNTFASKNDNHISEMLGQNVSNSSQTKVDTSRHLGNTTSILSDTSNVDMIISEVSEDNQEAIEISNSENSEIPVYSTNISANKSKKSSSINEKDTSNEMSQKHAIVLGDPTSNIPDKENSLKSTLVANIPDKSIIISESENGEIIETIDSLTSKNNSLSVTAISEADIPLIDETGNMSEVDSNLKTVSEPSDSPIFKSMEPIHSTTFKRSCSTKHVPEEEETLDKQAFLKITSTDISQNQSPSTATSNDITTETTEKVTTEKVITEKVTTETTEIASISGSMPVKTVEITASQTVSESSSPSFEKSDSSTADNSTSPIVTDSITSTAKKSDSSSVKKSKSLIINNSVSPSVKGITSPSIKDSTSSSVKGSTSSSVKGSTSSSVKGTSIVKGRTSPTVKDVTSPTVKDNTSATVKDITSPTVKDSTSPTVKNGASPTTNDSTSPITESSTTSITCEENSSPILNKSPVQLVEADQALLVQSSDSKENKATLEKASQDSPVDTNYSSTAEPSTSLRLETNSNEVVSTTEQTANFVPDPMSQTNDTVPSPTNLKTNEKPHSKVSMEEGHNDASSSSTLNSTYSQPHISISEVTQKDSSSVSENHASSSEQQPSDSVHNQKISSQLPDEQNSVLVSDQKTSAVVPDQETTLDNDESEEDTESTGDSITPPSPVDALRHRFEGLIDENSPAVAIRPGSPFRRMSFRSRKEAIALERTRDTSTEKPWFLQKPKIIETKKPIPKRSLKQQMETERKVRKMVADKKCRTYRKAEIVVQLMDLNFEEEESIQAANDCSTFEMALSYLQQECLLCTGHFPVSHIISMVHCPHKACRDCIRAYFTVQIRDRNIMELLCPFCNEPDISDEDIAQDYFNHLDMMLKKLVDPEIHELFQRKLRDRVLMRDPSFRWCSKCSSGFLAMENLKRLVCPDCNAVTCASCRRPWEREHQGISCEAFAALKDGSDPEAQAVGLARLLTEDGIDCPRCHFRYALAKGGCMHFRCIQCQHDFCSGCSRPFKMGQKCGVSEFCAKLGLHAHHPRNCLFYLRDKDPEDLQRLLDLSNVKYDREPSDEVDVKSTCQVMEQKETSEGMVDDYCGKEVEDGFAGLCRIHYVEYLGQLVNKHKVDPIQIFENDDLELVLRRANIRLPPKRYRETDASYREKLVNLIHEELPLDKMDGS